MTTTLSSREVYRDLLAGLMPADDRLVCLDSDTGLFSGVDFGTATGRYLNIGIAEHTLMGMAAGLARCGRIPFVNTMAAFATARALDAVKVDIALADLPVRIAATHSGLSAGHLGPTHHCLDDLAIMRALPNMTVLVPADAGQAQELIRQSLTESGPVYLRLGRNPTPDLPAAPPLLLGTVQELRAGDDVTLAACGPYPVLTALAAADLLGRDGISAGVLNVHTLKPLDTLTILRAASVTGLVLTVEEHWVAGGLGAAVAETLAEVLPVPVHRIGMPDSFVSVSGDQRYLLQQSGITPMAVAARARAALGRTVDPFGGDPQ